MNGAVLLLVLACWFVAAYVFYGRFLERLFGVQAGRATPAHTRRDGIDYVPTRGPVLFGHHFASIAGAGPIVGPVAAIYLGWFPTLMWIALGCVFVGAMHDFAAMLLSVRHDGRSIGHVIEGEIGYFGRQVFLLFSWAALVLVVAVFALLVAKTFVSTPAVATASLLFIAMAPVFGYLTNRRGLGLLPGSAIFVPLLFVFVWVGVLLPMDLAGRVETSLRSRGTVTVSGKTLAAAEKTLLQALRAEAGPSFVAATATGEGSKPLNDAVSAALGGLPGGGEVELSVLRAGAEAAARLGLRALGADDRGAAAAAEAFVGAVVRARASAVAQTFWLLVLFAYVFVASVVPVWILLQPRDYLNSYLLYAMILLGFAGILATAPRLQMSAWAGWSATDPSGQPGMLFPLLFVTVACGACSGFHALVASGTSAKQVDREAHILPVAYGGMLVEGLLAVMALISVGYLTGDEYRAIIVGKGSVAAFAGGLATFATRLGIPIQAGTTFVALAISAFMLTTLDTATRLTRFAWQELFLPRGMGASVGLGPLRRHLGNPWVATAVAVAVAGYLALSGEGMTIWPVFGASNQLLAALTLLAVSLYLIRRRLPYLVALLPMVLMVAISGWALVVLFGSNWGKRPALVLATLFLLAMAVLLIVLAVLSLRQARPAEQSVPGPG